MIEIRNITKKYGKVVANNDISLTVRDGEIAILLGPNGAGKSTLIKCIAGLLRFTGNIDIDGHANKEVDAKRAMGYVPEMPAVYDMLTVNEHLEFIARAYKLDDSWHARAQVLLERFELADKAEKLGKELSKGMQQKVSILCALLPQPRAVIFDEPLVGLDPHAIKQLKSIFRELREQGCAVLISTHMIDSVEDYWNVAHIMVHGSIAATKWNGTEQAGEKSLEDLFFDITEQAGGAEDEQ